jgi:hypothetical protein
MSDKYVSIPMSTGRVLSHGEITDLSEAFSLSGGVPFSVFVKPITGTDDIVEITCKCYLDSTASALPVVAGKWDEAAIVEISAAGIDLAEYKVFWGAGALPKVV